MRRTLAGVSCGVEEPVRVVGRGLGGGARGQRRACAARSGRRRRGVRLGAREGVVNIGRCSGASCCGSQASWVGVCRPEKVKLDSKSHVTVTLRVIIRRSEDQNERRLKIFR